MVMQLTLPNGSQSSDMKSIVLIESRPLVRQCLTQALAGALGQIVKCYPSVPDWLSCCDGVEADLVVLCVAASGGAAEVDVAALLAQLAERWRTVVLSDIETPKQILEVIERGARGYIPTSLTLSVMVEALRLVQAGAVFIPADALLAAQRDRNRDPVPSCQSLGLFTVRQAAVAEALRRGKSNKIIAYELNLRESTVKVHVRNIMKKLKAKNRTEVAYIANSLPGKAD